jgi:GTPase SAR1 family protein
MDSLETPFNIIILGMTGCGKTYYLLKMLENDYKNHFDYIFLICSTYEWNKTYQDWKYNKDKDFIAMPCKQDDVNPCLEYVSRFAEGTNSLIVLDDCASSQSVKNRTSELVKLGFSAKHMGISTIVITQQLTSIAKPYRENISKLVTFYNPRAKDTNIILDDYLANTEKEEKKEIINTLKNNDYARLEILLRRPYTHRTIIPHIK